MDERPGKRPKCHDSSEHAGTGGIVLGEINENEGFRKVFGVLLIILLANLVFALTLPVKHQYQYYCTAMTGVLTVSDFRVSAGGRP